MSTQHTTSHAVRLAAVRLALADLEAASAHNMAVLAENARITRRNAHGRRAAQVRRECKRLHRIHAASIARERAS